MIDVLMVSRKKARRNYRFVLWASFILEKRGIKVNLNSCIVDRILKVGEVTSLGTGCYFKAKTCYGCHAAQFLPGTNTLKSERNYCWLHETLIPSPVMLTEGETIYMPSLPSMLKGVPVLRYKGTEQKKGFFSSLF